MSNMMEEAIADGRVEILEASLAPVGLVFTIYAIERSRSADVIDNH
jgi:hypothetical protein